MASKVKLNFVIGTQKFSYIGHEEKREQDFFQMYNKIAGADQREEDLKACWDQNFPDRTDKPTGDIYSELQKEAARQKKKKDKKGSDKKDDDADKKDDKKEKKEKKDKKEKKEKKAAEVDDEEEKERENERRTRREQRKQKEEEALRVSEELKDFIDDIINQPEKGGRDLGASLGAKDTVPRVDSDQVATPPGPVLAQTSSTSIAAAACGSVQIKVRLENSDAQKIIIVKRTISHEDLFSEIDKKWDCTKLLGPGFIVAFEDEEGDRIEIDDTDTLQLFFDAIPEGKKGKVVVSAKKEDVYARVDPMAAPAPAPAPVEATAAASPPPAAATAQAVPGVTVATPGATPAVDREAPKAEACPNPKPVEYEKEADLPKAQIVTTLLSHEAAVFCCAFNTTGDMFCSSSRDKTLKIWDTKTEGFRVKHTLKGHQGFVLSCDFADNDTHVVSASDDGSARIWNAGNGKKVSKLKSHTDKVYCARFTPGSKHVATASIDKTARVWDVNTGKSAVTLESHTLPVFSCAFDHTGTILATASDDKLIKLWDWRQGVEIGTLKGHEHTLWSVGFSSDGKYIVSGSMGSEIKVWDFQKRELIKSIQSREAVHNAKFVKNDKYFISCGRDNSFSIWDTNTFELRSVTQAHKNIVYHTDVHNNFLMSASLDNTCKLWNFPEGL